MNINQLPENCLRTILAKLPIIDLLRIDRVCFLWKQLQPEVCQTVSSLTILIGDDPAKLIQNSTFKLTYLDDLTVDQRLYSQQLASCSSLSQIPYYWLDLELAKDLTNLFSNITNLVISIRGVNPTKCTARNGTWYLISLDPVVYLLESWTGLKSLQFYAHFTEEFQNDQIGRDFPKFIIKVNCLSLLKHLTIEFESYNSSPFQLDLPILQQLESFYFVMQNSYTNVFQSLTKYAKFNPKLTQIGFSDMNQCQIDPNFYGMEANKELCAKVVQLPNNQEFAKPNREMKVFCKRFVNLRDLTLTIANLPMFYKMMSLLEPMKSLVSLNIKLVSTYGNSESDEEEDEVRIVLPTLSSVKILTIYAPLDRHTVLCAFPWDQLLPELEVLHYIEGEWKCDICIGGEDWDLDKRRSECLRLTLRPFKDCTKLRWARTGFQGKERVWNLNQL